MKEKKNMNKHFLFYHIPNIFWETFFFILSEQHRKHKLLQYIDSKKYQHPCNHCSSFPFSFLFANTAGSPAPALVWHTRQDWPLPGRDDWEASGGRVAPRPHLPVHPRRPVQAAQTRRQILVRGGRTIGIIHRRWELNLNHLYVIPKKYERNCRTRK